MGKIRILGKNLHPPQGQGGSSVYVIYVPAHHSDQELSKKFKDRKYRIIHTGTVQAPPEDSHVSVMLEDFSDGCSKILD